MPINDYRYGGSKDRYEVIKVKGEGGAKSVAIPPNSSCLAMDIDDPIVYLVMTDSTGYPSVEAYSIARIPTESEKAASAIENVTQTLSNVMAQMTAMTEKINKLEASLNG